MMTENQELTHEVIGELRELRDNGEFYPDPDIDMVWVFSGHGTYDQEGNQPPYDGVSFDRLNFDAGVQAVREITANRLGKELEDVTKDDIAEHGPTLFYNGESEADTEGMHYPQNEAVAAATEDDDFPLPPSKVVIRPIAQGHTPAQMDSFILYAEELRADGKVPPQKVAVVSSFAHRARVGRYLTHYEDKLPEDTTFVNGPIPREAEAEVNGMAIVVAEIRRIKRYRAAGHLATESALASAA